MNWRGPAEELGTIHGGDLADAAALAGEASAETGRWLDLSTGINPIPYPLPAIDRDAWARLPGRSELEALVDVAAAYYGASDRAGIVVAPGSQLLIQLVPVLFEPCRVAVLWPSYGEHAPAWCNRGHDVRPVEDPDAADADVLLLVHPNNPDGRIFDRASLRRWAERQSARDGWLAIDEAFADLVPEVSGVDLVAETNTVVIKSVGKFFGLGGLRLGFMIAPGALAARTRALLGPWPVSGPAIAVGRKALADRRWQAEARADLARRAARLDATLTSAGIAVVGGTALFRLFESAAAQLFQHLLAHRIYVRRFSYAPRWLRLGLPGTDRGFDRLAAALAAFAGR